MKITVDLPNGLIKQVRRHAAQTGRTLKEAVAELLRKGLLQPTCEAWPQPVVQKDPETGLPVIRCKHPASPGEELTPERIAEILLAQEVEWFMQASGAYFATT